MVQINVELDNQVLRDVVDLTEKVNQLSVRIEKNPLQNSPNQTSILHLPPEILEMIFQRISVTQDAGNCSIALVGTRHENFAIQKFLKPQLKIFASLDLNLNKSLKNEGWFEECQNTKLIINLWKKFKPFLPGEIFLDYHKGCLSQYFESV